MTQNQIMYWTLQETKRSNLERERQGRDTIAENIRHNRSSESIGWGNLSEGIRHNTMMENLHKYATDKNYEIAWNHDTVSLINNATQAAGDVTPWLGAVVGGVSLMDRLMANAGYTGLGSASPKKSGVQYKKTINASVTPPGMKGR